MRLLSWENGLAVPSAKEKPSARAFDDISNFKSPAVVEETHPMFSIPLQDSRKIRSLIP